MAGSIDFYFDFSSPYSFLASEGIDGLAARYGRTVNYRPILLGAIFKASGGAPLTEQYGPKAKYSVHDFSRSARFAGIRYRHPSKFPISSVAPNRAVLALQRDRPEQVPTLVHALFRALFQDDRDVSDAAVVAEVANSIGLDGAKLAEEAQAPAVKDALRKAVEDATALGVFGAPTIVVDGEMFWGNDRLPQIERWLASGPF
jgi:2-hydroxychromene-2-carboxylate isomerase